MKALVKGVAALGFAATMAGAADAAVLTPPTDEGFMRINVSVEQLSSNPSVFEILAPQVFDGIADISGVFASVASAGDSVPTGLVGALITLAPAPTMNGNVSFTLGDLMGDFLTFDFADTENISGDAEEIEGFVSITDGMETIDGSWYFTELQGGAILTIETPPNFVINKIPVPAALPLLATGLAGLGFLARRRKA